MLLATLIITAVSFLFSVRTANTENDRAFQNSRFDFGDYPDYGDSFLPDRSNVLPSDPYDSQDSASAETRAKSSERRSEDDRDNFRLVDNWPDASKQLGQLSAVSLDVDGNAVVFHRGDRVWGSRTFRADNVYDDRSAGPIPENTIVVFDATTGKVLRETGAKMFYMPHGLTIDASNNVWVTDVALHQVFKLPPITTNGATAPLLTLGIAFVPGNDAAHFCKPTDVAVAADGSFFVSDGYCNSRIMKFSAAGTLLMQWGRSTRGASLRGALAGQYELNVPHALALAEDRDMLCAADRENGRVQCFDARNGSFVASLKSPELGSRIFSVAYSPVEGGLLFAVNAPEFSAAGAAGAHGSLVRLSAARQVAARFAPTAKGFSNPHDVTVSRDGRRVFVVELNPYRVWQFRRGGDNASLDGVPAASPPGPPRPSLPPSLSSLPPSNGSGLMETLRSIPSEPRGTLFVSLLGVAVVTFAVAVVVAAARMRRRGKRGAAYSGEHAVHYDKLIQ